MGDSKREIVVINQDMIKNKIYDVRNQKVMLDFELAEIYGYTTTRFNEQVKNNSGKFDDDFMFRLTNDEFENLISKKSISSWGGRRKLPYAFTEQGTENEAIYHCGSSSKDAGNKISSITRIEDLNLYLYHSIFDELLNNDDLQIL